MTTSSESAAGLLPATRRALTHRVAVGQAEGRTPSLAAAVVRDGGQAWFGSRSMLDGHEPDRLDEPDTLDRLYGLDGFDEDDDRLREHGQFRCICLQPKFAEDR